MTTRIETIAVVLTEIIEVAPEDLRGRLAAELDAYRQRHERSYRELRRLPAVRVLLDAIEAGCGLE